MLSSGEPEPTEVPRDSTNGDAVSCPGKSEPIVAVSRQVFVSDHNPPSLSVLGTGSSDTVMVGPGLVIVMKVVPKVVSVMVVVPSIDSVGPAPPDPLRDTAPVGCPLGIPEMVGTP